MSPHAEESLSRQFSQMVDGALRLCRKEDLAEGIDRSHKVAATDVDPLCLEKSLKLLVQHLSKFAPWYNEGEAGLHNQLDGINDAALWAEAVKSLGTALQAFMALSLDGKTLDELLKFEAELVQGDAQVGRPCSRVLRDEAQDGRGGNRVHQHCIRVRRRQEVHGCLVWVLAGRRAADRPVVAWATCTFLRHCAWSMLFAINLWHSAQTMRAACKHRVFCKSCSIGRRG